MVPAPVSVTHRQNKHQSCSENFLGYTVCCCSWWAENSKGDPFKNKPHTLYMFNLNKSICNVKKGKRPSWDVFSIHIGFQAESLSPKLTTGCHDRGRPWSLCLQWVMRIRGISAQTTGCHDMHGVWTVISSASVNSELWGIWLQTSDPAVDCRFWPLSRSLWGAFIDRNRTYWPTDVTVNARSWCSVYQNNLN